MVMIQDGPQNTGADKPLRISGEPFKVQVGFVFFLSLPFFHEKKIHGLKKCHIDGVLKETYVA